MEFRFNLNEIFKMPIVEVGQTLIPSDFKGDRRGLWDALSKVTDVINAMGSASAAAQNLTRPITTADRLRNSDQQQVYLLIDQDAFNGKGAVTGMLKTGKKGLYVFDREGHHYHVQSPCVLDFYVHESRQRSGYGKKLFEHMLQREEVHPEKLAIDRPSEKFLGFLNKHYNLSNPIRQMNNYVVYDGFFPQVSDKNDKSPINNNGDSVSKRGSNGLQSQIVTSPYGRYGAPRPPCSMGQIIHNQSAAMPVQEPTGEMIKNTPDARYPPFQHSNSIQEAVSAQADCTGNQTAGDGLGNVEGGTGPEYYWPFVIPSADYPMQIKHNTYTSNNIYDLLQPGLVKEELTPPPKVPIDELGRPQHNTPQKASYQTVHRAESRMNPSIHQINKNHQVNKIVDERLSGATKFNHFSQPLVIQQKQAGDALSLPEGQEYSNMCQHSQASIQNGNYQQWNNNNNFNHGNGGYYDQQLIQNSNQPLLNYQNLDLNNRQVINQEVMHQQNLQYQQSQAINHNQQQRQDLQTANQQIFQQPQNIVYQNNDELVQNLHAGDIQNYQQPTNSQQYLQSINQQNIQKVIQENDEIPQSQNYQRSQNSQNVNSKNDGETQNYQTGNQQSIQQPENLQVVNQLQNLPSINQHNYGQLQNLPTTNQQNCENLQSLVVNQQPQHLRNNEQPRNLQIVNPQNYQQPENLKAIKGQHYQQQKVQVINQQNYNQQPENLEDIKEYHYQQQNVQVDNQQNYNQAQNLQAVNQQQNLQAVSQPHRRESQYNLQGIDNILQATQSASRQYLQQSNQQPNVQAINQQQNMQRENQYNFQGINNNLQRTQSASRQNLQSFNQQPNIQAINRQQNMQPNIHKQAEKYQQNVWNQSMQQNPNTIQPNVQNLQQQDPQQLNHKLHYPERNQQELNFQSKNQQIINQQQCNVEQNKPQLVEGQYMQQPQLMQQGTLYNQTNQLQPGGINSHQQQPQPNTYQYQNKKNSENIAYQNGGQPQVSNFQYSQDNQEPRHHGYQQMDANKQRIIEPLVPVYTDSMPASQHIIRGQPMQQPPSTHIGQIKRQQVQYQTSRPEMVEAYPRQQQTTIQQNQYAPSSRVIIPQLAPTSQTQISKKSTPPAKSRSIVSSPAQYQPIAMSDGRKQVNQTDISKMKQAPHIHSFGDFSRDQLGTVPEDRFSNGLQMPMVSKENSFMKFATSEDRLQPTEPFHRDPSKYRPNSGKPRNSAVAGLRNQIEVLKTLSSIVLEQPHGKKQQTSINPLERNISSAIQRSKTASSKLFERQSQIYCGQAALAEKRKTNSTSRGGTQAPPKVEQQEIPQPKLDRPQTLSLITSSDDLHHAKSEVQAIIVANSELDNIENDFMRIEVSPRPSEDALADEEPQARKTPSHLTDQGYFDLKFYHNKLW